MSVQVKSNKPLGKPSLVAYMRRQPSMPNHTRVTDAQSMNLRRKCAQAADFEEAWRDSVDFFPLPFVLTCFIMIPCITQISMKKYRNSTLQLFNLHVSLGHKGIPERRGQAGFHGRLQSMGLLGVGHYWATSLSFFTFTHWRRKWQPTPVSCLENPRDRGAWWAAIYGVA